VLRRVVDKQVDVFGLAVHFDKLSLEFFANLGEYDFEPLDSFAIKYVSSILCNKDQMNMK